MSDLIPNFIKETYYKLLDHIISNIKNTETNYIWYFRTLNQLLVIESENRIISEIKFKLYVILEKLISLN
jgi:hypothetical protein